MDALDAAFYLAFKNVEKSDKKTLIALDVSASMTWGNCNGVPGLTPRVGSAAMSMVTAKACSQHHFVGFSDKIVPIKFTKNARLSEVINTIERIPMGGTDCAAPMRYALEKNIEVDTFVVYTDNETYGGTDHVFQALEEYRRKMNINAKLIVVGMTATNFTIANPDDPGMMDLAGFDASTPALINAFSEL